MEAVTETDLMGKMASGKIVSASPNLNIFIDQMSLA
jgi:hypothetical protein